MNEIKQEPFKMSFTSDSIWKLLFLQIKKI